MEFQGNSKAEISYKKEKSHVCLFACLFLFNQSQKSEVFEIEAI